MISFSILGVWRVGGGGGCYKTALNGLRGGGCVMVLEIDSVGQCEVFVCLDFVHFFFLLATKLIGP